VRSGKVRRARANLAIGSEGFASDKPLENNETDEASSATTFELEKSRVEKKEKRATNVAPKKGTRIPPDWHLSPALLDFALTADLTEVEAGIEADQFRDHWRSATRNATKLDWGAAWRTWVRNAVKWKPQQRINSDDRTARLMQMADGFDQRAAADCEVDNGAGDGDAEPLLPAKSIA